MKLHRLTPFILHLVLLLSGCDLVYWDENFDSYKNLSATNPHPFHSVQISDKSNGQNKNDESWFFQNLSNEPVEKV